MVLEEIKCKIWVFGWFKYVIMLNICRGSGDSSMVVGWGRGCFLGGRRG